MLTPNLQYSLSLVLAISGLAFVLGRVLVVQKARTGQRHLVSLPVFYSWYCGLGTLLPTLSLALLGWFLSVPGRFLFTALPVIALACAVFLLLRIHPAWAAQKHVEQMIRNLLVGCGGVVFFTSVGIGLSLLTETVRFFSSDKVSFVEFFTGMEWAAQTEAAFGALPLFYGTFFVALIALIFAAPVGLFSAIYLSEYASPMARRIGKPFLEILAGVPTVVYGFFALLLVGPLVRELGDFLNDLVRPLNNGADFLPTRPQNALSAGLVMGIMILPYISSLSDDVMRSVPARLRNAALGLGATQSEALKHVVLPAAFPGLMAAMILAISRAIGETMIVLMAVGDRAQITLNPFEDVSTVTVQIVSLLTSDSEFDTPRTLSAFALGAILFALTMSFNLFAQWITARQRRRYAGV